MSQQYQPVEPSPDPFERFPLYTPPADPAAAPVPARSGDLVPLPPQSPVPARAGYASGLVLTDERVPNTTVSVVAWVVAVVTSLYMLPWAIAATRGQANQWAIFAGNLLLGWTLVGWIVALLYAVFCALRLARFNAQIDDDVQPRKLAGFLTGIPAPAGAALAMLRIKRRLAQA